MSTEGAVTDLLARARELSCSALSDALDRLGIEAQLNGIYGVDPNFRICGPAFTVGYRPVQTRGETVGDYIDDVAEGAVIVIDNSSRLDCTVWGDILTETALVRRLGGTVIDGTCRDSQSSVELGYPIFSRSRWMRTGKDRVCVESVQKPIILSGIEVCPNDVLIGDRDGVVAVPGARLEEVVDVARSIEDTEEQIRQAVRSGDRLDVARERLGYHQLQQRNDA
jgi:regulator of RNase E activity RraA